MTDPFEGVVWPEPELARYAEAHGIILRLQAPRSSLPPVICSQRTRGGIYTMRQRYPLWDQISDSTWDIPVGFEWDGASVPAVGRVAVPPFSLSIVFGLGHDLGYRFRGKMPREIVTPYRTYTRAEIDEIGRRLMVLEGVRAWRRKIAYAAITSEYGQRAWGNKEPKLTLDR